MEHEQWIADVYHCCEEWGQKMTVEEMHEMLEEYQLKKFPDDYSPDPALAEECTAYWNELCELYPN